jgi:hypothetical protein
MTDVTDGVASAEGATTATPGPVQGSQPASTPATPGSPAQPVQVPERQGPQGELEKLRALTSRLQSERDQYEARARQLEASQEELRQNSQQQYMQSLSQMAPQERATLLEQEFQAAMTPDPNQIRSEQKTQTLTELLGDARQSFTADEWNDRSDRLRTGQLSASSLMREAYTRTVNAGIQATAISGSGAPQGPEVPDVGAAAPPAPPDTYTPEEIADIAATNPARYRELVAPGGKPKPGVTLTVEASQAAAVPISE